MTKVERILVTRPTAVISAGRCIPCITSFLVLHVLVFVSMKVDKKQRNIRRGFEHVLFRRISTPSNSVEQKGEFSFRSDDVIYDVLCQGLLRV